VEIARRDTLTKETISRDNVVTHVVSLMDEIHNNILRKATAFREENTHYVNSWDEFLDVIENKGGFVMAHWDGTPETEEQIKNLTKATIRVIPFDSPAEEGKCVYSGNPSVRRVLFARAY
jgi:prolyl-tRNA synthetase